MKRTSVPFFLSGKHAEADVLRTLKKKQRQCMQLEEGKWVIKEELSKEREMVLFISTSLETSHISLWILFFIISGKGTCDH